MILKKRKENIYMFIEINNMRKKKSPVVIGSLLQVFSFISL